MSHRTAKVEIVLMRSSVPRRENPLNASEIAASADGLTASSRAAPTTEPARATAPNACTARNCEGTAFIRHPHFQRLLRKSQYSRGGAQLRYIVYSQGIL